MDERDSDHIHKRPKGDALKQDIPFFQHDLGREELKSVAEVLAGPILTTGETVGAFERRFAEYLRRGHALGVSSCTGAIHLSLLALGIGPGDEVITTPMTFIATATGIIEAGARPVFVEVERETGNLDASRIEEAITERTRAILPVHLYGHMCDMLAIRRIADAHRLSVIEDSAHCIEGERDGVRPGDLSDTACFSFYATKNITCGEGGAVVTDNNELAERLRLLRLHGMTKTANDRLREGYKHWDMIMMGWKYNMDNIQAAFLLPQMERIDQNWRRRSALAQRYESGLGGVTAITLPKTLPNTKHARHLFPVWIGDGRRDAVIDGFRAKGIGAMVNYRAIHLTHYFREAFGWRRGDFPIAEELGDAVLSLPFYPAMPEAHVDIVSKTLAELV